MNIEGAPKPKKEEVANMSRRGFLRSAGSVLAAGAAGYAGSAIERHLSGTKESNAQNEATTSEYTEGVDEERMRAEAAQHIERIEYLDALQEKYQIGWRHVVEHSYLNSGRKDGSWNNDEARALENAFDTVGDWLNKTRSYSANAAETIAAHTLEEVALFVREYDEAITALDNACGVAQKLPKFIEYLEAIKQHAAGITKI